MIGTTVEVYIEDIVVKNCTLEDRLNDIHQVLHILDKIGMKLNLENCNFRVKDEKFLGYIVSESSIEANLEK